MFWIEGISRTPSGFALDTLLANGSRIQQPLHCLASKLAVGRTTRRRITTNCAEWTRTPGEAFWKLLGVQNHRPQDGHAVFQLVDDGKRFLIPASVVIAAMMRPIKYMQGYLFRPHGLESFSVPQLDKHHPSIGLCIPQHKVFGSSSRTPNGLLASYSWMHCFPSARAMWDSVYLGADGGLLDIAPPKATITMTVHSVKRDGFRLVTDLVIMSLNANEEPFGFAEGHPTEIVFHDSATMDWKACHRPHCTIPARGDEWRLSNEEWRELSAVLRPRLRAKFDLRQIIDLILIKFGTGRAWRKLDVGRLNFPIIQGTYQRMQKDGSWTTIEGLLKETRRVTVT